MEAASAGTEQVRIASPSSDSPPVVRLASAMIGHAARRLSWQASVAPPAAETPREMATAGSSSEARVTVSASCQIGADAAIAPSITSGYFMRNQPDSMPP